jgi:hypothetical protein
MTESQTTPDAGSSRINPLKLPTITMMVGGDPRSNLDLAKAIIARDQDCETMYFEQPAIDGTSVALSGTYHMVEQLAMRRASADTMETFFKMVELLEPLLIPLAVERLSEDIGTYFCARILFLDANYDRVKEMCKSFKAEELAVIQLGALQSPPTGLSLWLWKHVWLPSPSITERMSVLEREFGLIEAPAEEG